MRGVVRAVLQRVVKSGLPGEHHFYISFLTQAPGVVLSKRLKEKYPSEMTIVLQHRFWDLIVSDDRFEVKLTFDGIPERLVVPFAAIKVFIDPSVRYGLQFEDPDMEPEAGENMNQRFAGRRPEHANGGPPTLRSTAPKKPRVPRKASPRRPRPSSTRPRRRPLPRRSRRRRSSGAAARCRPLQACRRQDQARRGKGGGEGERGKAQRRPSAPGQRRRADRQPRRLPQEIIAAPNAFSPSSLRRRGPRPPRMRANLCAGRRPPAARGSHSWPGRRDRSTQGSLLRSTLASTAGSIS